MKQFLRSLAISAVMFVIFYVLVVSIVGWLPFKNLNYKLGAYGHLYTRVREIDSVKNVNVLFLGSSHSYRGLDPRIFKAHGITSFNLGSSSQTPVQAKILLEKYFAKLNPKMVIYEVSPMTFSNDGIESSLDLIANDEITKPVVKMAFELNHLKTYNSLLYAMVRSALPVAPFREPVRVGKDVYIPGGYVEREMDYYHKPKGTAKRASASENKLNDIQKKEFAEIVEYLKNKNTQLVLIQTPVTSDFYNSQANKSREFDELIAKSKVAYYDFNKLLSLDDSLHFYDQHHLNQRGVEQFNGKLIEVLFKKQERLAF